MLLNLQRLQQFENLRKRVNAPQPITAHTVIILLMRLFCGLFRKRPQSSDILNDIHHLPTAPEPEPEDGLTLADAFAAAFGAALADKRANGD